MKKALHQVSLKVFLKNEKGEILLMKGVFHGTFAGFYDFPGGRINADEMIVATMDILMREVREELGDVKISVDPKPASYGRILLESQFTEEKSGDVGVFYLFFEATYLSGEIKISDEHLEYKWVKLTDKNIPELIPPGLREGVKFYLSSHA